VGEEVLGGGEGAAESDGLVGVVVVVDMYH